MSERFYSGDNLPDHCSYCKRPFLNGEVFGILPEDPKVSACDKCSRIHYSNDDALLIEIHLTGKPIRGEAEMRCAHRAISLFQHILTEDDPRVGDINASQRTYLNERFDALMVALGETQMIALPEGEWGMGKSTR